MLDLHPAKNFDEDVNCDLSIISLRDSGRKEYEALSYVWGKELSKQPIHVNGIPFVVTENLHVALRYLRDSTSCRTVWVDAVCINQSDLAERSHQVANMRYIYGGALQVLIWFGEATSATDEALRFIKYTHEALERSVSAQKWTLLRPVHKGVQELLQRP